MRLLRSRLACCAVTFAFVGAPPVWAEGELGPPLRDLASLDTPAALRSSEPSLAVAVDGGVFMSWFEKVDSTRHALRLSRLARGKWSKPETVAEGDSFFVNWADVPALVALGGDKLMMAWPWKSGGDPYAYDVRIAGSMDGGRHWTPPIIPHRDGTKTEHGFVSLVPAQVGGARAFWLDGRKFSQEKASQDSGHAQEGHGEMTLRTAWIGLDGALADEAEVDDRVCDCCPTSAVGHSGSAVVAYRDRTRGEVRDISVAWIGGHRCSDPAPVHADGWKTPGCPVNGPALDGEGDRLAVAWFTQPGDSGEVRVAFSNDRGRSFGAPTRVDEGNPMGRVGVILLGDGSALVGWLESRGSQAAFQVRRVSAAGRPGPAMTVARTSSARGAGFPRMVRSRDRVVFAWTATGEAHQVQVAVARIP